MTLSETCSPGHASARQIFKLPNDTYNQYHTRHCGSPFTSDYSERFLLTPSASKSTEFTKRKHELIVLQS